MKKVISCLLLISILLIPVLFVNAVDQYEYVDYNPIIMPKEFFESLFSADEVEKISYNCKISPVEEGQTADVVLDIDLLIGKKHYKTVFQGEIDIYTLPDNDILYEGPIYGVINVNDIDYKVIAGITSLKSTGETRITLTVQDINYGFVSISFGDNVIKGKVLDHFNERLGNSNNSQTDVNQEITQNESENANVNSMSPDFSQTIDPEFGSGSGESGDRDDNSGYFDLGENGKWKFQSKSVASHPSAIYTALQSRVYFDASRNILMVTVKPYCQSTEKYILSLGYTYVQASLVSFGASLKLYDEDASHYAYIDGVDYLEYLESDNNSKTLYLSDYFLAMLSDIGVPSSTLSVALNKMKGGVKVKYTKSNASILVSKDIFSPINFDDLENIETGLPFEFQLTTSNSLYEGNTKYTVTASIQYIGMTQTVSVYGETTYYSRYMDYTTTHDGTVTLTR